jgi:hypothetical protein
LSVLRCFFYQLVEGHVPVGVEEFPQMLLDGREGVEEAG